MATQPSDVNVAVLMTIAQEIRQSPHLRAKLRTPELLSADLYQFVLGAWHVVEPTTPIVAGPYMQAMCHHLQRLTESWEKMQGADEDEVEALLSEKSNFRNLIINVPPRSAKSTIVSVMWPAWVWTRRPGVRFLTSSYAYSLAERDAMRTRRLIMSEWYQRRWGDMVALSTDMNRMARYDNTRLGYRIGVSRSGSTTGEGGDCLIADDPQSALDAGSDTALGHVKSWFGDVWSNRRNDPKRSLMVMVQQRLHEDDLTGHLLAQGGWVHLNLPMEYEGEREPNAIGWVDWREEEGEWLYPARFGEREKQEVVRFAGEIGWATQFQQRPVGKGGGILKVDRWARYYRAELPERFRRVAAFADTAAKARQRNDYTAIALWGEHDGNWWLLDLVWDKFEFPELVETASRAWARWKLFPVGQRPTKFVVEDASSGTQLIQTLRKQARIPIIEYNARGDKEERVNAIAGYQYNGMLHLPADDMQGLGVFDVSSFINEHAMFPNGRHDDRVDSSTMMMMYWEIEPPDEPYRPGIVATAVAKGRW